MGQEPQGHAGEAGTGTTGPEGLSPPPGRKGDDDAHLGPGGWGCQAVYTETDSTEYLVSMGSISRVSSLPTIRNSAAGMQTCDVLHTCLSTYLGM